MTGAENMVPEQDVILAHACIDAIERALFGDVKERDRDTLVERAERLRETLAFYANSENWKWVLEGTVSAGEPNDGAQSWVRGPADDLGKRAMEALDA